MKAQHTHGPWQVVVTEHPHHLGGKHIERRIFTVWEHPQLKGPWPVVNMSVGIGAKEGGKPVSLCHIDEADARLIAAAPDLLDALIQAEVLLNRLGDTLNEMDAVEEEDEAFATPIFKSVRDAIAKATGAHP